MKIIQISWWSPVNNFKRKGSTNCYRSPSRWIFHVTTDKKEKRKGRKKVDNIKIKIIIYAHLSTCLVIVHISQSAYKLPTKRKSGAQSRPISHQHSLSPALTRKVVSFVIWLQLCVFLCTELFGTKNSLEVIRTTISMLTISPGFLLRLTVKFYPVFILVVVVIHAIHDM